MHNLFSHYALSTKSHYITSSIIPIQSNLSSDSTKLIRVLAATSLFKIITIYLHSIIMPNPLFKHPSTFPFNSLSLFLECFINLSHHSHNPLLPSMTNNPCQSLCHTKHNSCGCLNPHQINLYHTFHNLLILGDW